MSQDPTNDPQVGGEDRSGDTGAAEQAAPAPAEGAQHSAPAGGDEPAQEHDQLNDSVTDSDDVEGEPAVDELTKTKNELLTMADELARAKADLYNAEQRHNAYVQRSRQEILDAKKRGHEEVVEALIAVLDDIELARQHGELEGPFKSIAEKLEEALKQKFEVERFGEQGEDFDPNIHEALMHNPKEGVESDVIDVVMQPGYRVGDKVVRPARVGVAGPA
ncbi:MAG TPA: nucleotide exchange factor GrpE [Beutenbergiaceae bacterium]|nr:nucleotide exchange factor GrpE [Beutenbergiaceae bacterium]